MKIVLFVWNKILLPFLPAHLQYEVIMASIAMSSPERVQEGRQSLRRVWKAWWLFRTRRDPAMVGASILMMQGWRLQSQWSLEQGDRLSCLDGIVLSNLAAPLGHLEPPVFEWDSPDEPAPVEAVYQLLELPERTWKNGFAWRICFWLALFTEEETARFVKRERRRTG